MQKLLMNVSNSWVVTIKPRDKKSNSMPLRQASSEDKFHSTQETKSFLQPPPHANAKKNDNSYKRNGCRGPEHLVGTFLFQGPPQSPHTEGVKFPTVVSVECLGCPGTKFPLRKMCSPKQVQYFLIVFSFTQDHGVI